MRNLYEFNGCRAGNASDLPVRSGIYHQTRVNRLRAVMYMFMSPRPNLKELDEQLLEEHQSYVLDAMYQADPDGVMNVTRTYARSLPLEVQATLGMFTLVPERLDPPTIVSWMHAGASDSSHGSQSQTMVGMVVISEPNVDLHAEFADNASTSTSGVDDDSINTDPPSPPFAPLPLEPSLMPMDEDGGSMEMEDPFSACEQRQIPMNLIEDILADTTGMNADEVAEHAAQLEWAEQNRNESIDWMVDMFYEEGTAAPESPDVTNDSGVSNLNVASVE
jgi:hypothetical protein